MQVVMVFIALLRALFSPCYSHLSTSLPFFGPCQAIKKFSKVTVHSSNKSTILGFLGCVKSFFLVHDQSEWPGYENLGIYFVNSFVCMILPDCKLSPSQCFFIKLAKMMANDFSTNILSLSYSSKWYVNQLRHVDTSYVGIWQLHNFFRCTYSWS